DQLTLATADRNHGVNRLDTSLHWFVHRLTEYHTWCFTLQWHVIQFTCNRTSTVDWLTQCVYHTADDAITYFYRGNTVRSSYSGAFFDFAVVAKHYGTYVVFFQVQNKRLKSVLKL